MQPDWSGLIRVDKLKLQAKWRKLKGGENNQALETFASDLAQAKQRFQEKMAPKLVLTYPDLPISQAKQAIMKLIDEHQVVIIAGETGSGKSTQLAKMCLELGLGKEGLIGHTQPRRLAARAVADRVAEELGQSLGETIGYQVRFHDKLAPTTRVKVMTDGILLNELSRDRYLDAYDVLIIDEAHERSLNIDILLGFLKRIIQKRPSLKVMITSATIELEAFAKFFNDAPILEVPGKLYPVEVHTLEKQLGEDFFTHLLRTIDVAVNTTHRDLLVFLSGEGEIYAAKKSLNARYGKQFEICPLFARLNLSEQRKIFKPSNTRRLILTTNVAETSLTVPNIDGVVDAGFARISRYSYRSKIQRLPIEPIAQSSAKQRMGRAGRLSDGHVFRMYSQEDFQSRPMFTPPEIQRTNLAQVVLQMAPLGVHDLNQFDWLNPPDSRHVTDAVKQLERLGALSEGRLSAIGKQMARMPLEPKLSRILVAAHQHHCLKEILIIISALCIQDPREYPREKQAHAKQVHHAYHDRESDFLSFVLLWDHIAELRDSLSGSAFRKHCQSHFLNIVRILEWQDVHRQLYKMVNAKHLNEKPATYEQVHKALLCGLFETVGLFSPEQQCFIGPRNIKFQLSRDRQKQKAKWVMTFELIELSRVIANTVAKIEAKWIEQSAGHLCKYEPGEMFWDERSGYVKLYQRVKFFGLTLASKRACDLKEHDRQAVHIFCDQALIEGKLPQFSFVRHNLKQVEYLQSLEIRMRRLSGLYDSQALLDHYLTIFADEPIYSVKALEQWIKQNGELTLEVAPEAISFDKNLAAIEQAFPSTYQIDALHLDIEYCFDLRREDDGATIIVPIALLDVVMSHDFSWGLPGFLQDMVTWYVESIDLKYRRQLPTVKQATQDLIGNLDKSLPFLEAFKQCCQTLYQVQIPLQSLQALDRPSAYAFNFKVMNQDEVLAESRDKQVLFSLLKTHLKELSQTVTAKQGCKTWDFGDLPHEQMVTIDGHQVSMCPTLVDQTTHVDIEFLRDKHQAQKAHAWGVTRLCILSDAKKYQYYKKNLKHLAWLKQHLKSVLDYPEFLDDLLLVAYYQSFVADSQPIYRQHDFEQRLDEMRLILPEVINKLADLLVTIVKQVQALQLVYPKLKKTNCTQSLTDLDNQIDGLVFDGFLRQVPYDWLKRYPVYLKALLVRAEKWVANPNAEKTKLQKLSPFIEKYLQVCEGREDEGCQRYRWLIEEYRISLFAQPLKPQLSVSDKKMKQWLKDLI